jgi:hypothetical protein
MADKYKILTVDEQHAIIIEYLHAQERDLFIHKLNRDRYDILLKTLDDGVFKDRIVHLRTETESRINEVENIVSVTTDHMVTLDGIDARITTYKASKA